MKIYTRTGDTGETALLGGGRVAKNHPRVEAYGTVDELNATLGKALGALDDAGTRARLGRIQHDLFNLGALLAAPPPSEGRRRAKVPPFPSARVAEMESWMDEAEGELPPLTQFILPGGTRSAADLHLCRTVCRRAERAVVGLDEGDEELASIVRYLNRLSDLFFVLARLENHRLGVDDTPWDPDAHHAAGALEGEA